MLGLDGGKKGGQPLLRGALRRATPTLSQKLRRCREHDKNHRAYDSKLFDRRFLSAIE